MMSLRTEADSRMYVFLSTLMSLKSMVKKNPKKYAKDDLNAVVYR